MLGGRAVDRITLGGRVLLLTTVGRRSGRPRTVPLGGFQHGVDVVVAGTNGGLSKLPDWVLNLSANPAAELQIGSEHYPAVAEFLDGHEWETLWAELTRTYPGYADARRWAHRRIPLIRLRRSSGRDDERGTGRASAEPATTPADQSRLAGRAYPSQIRQGMASPAGFGYALTTYLIPIEGRDEWLAAARVRSA